MTKKKPEVENELRVEVKGYGCDDDCTEYFAKVTGNNCGYRKTPKDNMFW